MVQHSAIDHSGLTGVPSTTAPNPTTIELGHASDTTLSRASAGVVAVEGTNLVKAGVVTGSGLTMATARLLGRSTASSGAIEEITVGSGLSLSAGSLTSTGSSAPIASGTSNPGSPSTDDLFHRTDLDRLIRYDGTRWLTIEEFALEMRPFTAFPPYSANGNDLTCTTDLTHAGMWITRVTIAGVVLTTNDGSNFWTFQLVSTDASVTETNVGSTANTSATAAGSYAKYTVTIGAAVAAGNIQLRLKYTKTSAPGNLYATAIVHYRLIVT